MRNIYEILKGIGIEIPEDKKEAFDKAVNENYKTIKEVEGLNTKLSNAEQERDIYKTKYDTDIAQRDTDLATLKKQLEDAGEDTKKLEELTTQLSTLQTTYDTAKTDYEKQLIKQKKEFLIKESVNALKFSSNSAKKAFLADVIEKDLPVENDKILGFEDFVNAYKEQDAGAFVVEDNGGSAGKDEPKPKPQFTGKTNNLDSGNDGGTEQKEIPSSTMIW